MIAAAGERIDGLANVAGIMDGFLPPAEVDDDTWSRVMAVNVTGPMRLTRAVLAFFHGPQGIRANAVAPGAVLPSGGGWSVI